METPSTQDSETPSEPPTSARITRRGPVQYQTSQMDDTHTPVPELEDSLGNEPFMFSDYLVDGALDDLIP
jgi:hypothetical protein